MKLIYFFVTLLIAVLLSQCGSETGQAQRESKSDSTGAAEMNKNPEERPGDQSKPNETTGGFRPSN